MKKIPSRPYLLAPLWVVVILLVVAPLVASAKNIDPKRAVKIAQKYVTLRSDQKKQAAKSSRSVADTPYYIYNDARGQGFVIVSGNDAMGQVLAYSTEGTLDTLNANPCVKWLLEGYRQTYNVVKQQKGVAQAAQRAPLFTKTVAPLLKTKWGQSHPFNAQTGYPYSGCVATAMAQIMYYHQWPAHGYGQSEYTVTYDQTPKSADFSRSYYRWEQMLPDYRYPVQATAEQEDAVAQLMSDVGIASFMQYTPHSSGTQGLFAYQALPKHFDYSAAYVTRAIEGPSRFAEILRQELLKGCPVYLEGRPSNTASGHAWVADGFDENGLFHMNFGWEGQGDAYYSLTHLSPTQTGSEFQGKPLTFNRAVTAILAHPNNGKHPEIERGLLESSPQLMFNEGGTLTLKGVENKSFDPTQTLNVEMNSFVNRGTPFRGDVGIVVYDAEDNLVRMAYSDDHAQGGFTERIYGADLSGFMGTDYLVNQPLSVPISLKGLASGYYRLVAVCAIRNGDGTWSDLFRIKKAPIIEVELTPTAGRVSETSSPDARFQLMAQPRLEGTAEQGGSVQAYFTVKNLNGVPRDCYLRVQLLDNDQTVVLSERVGEPTEIEGFAENDLPILLSLPQGIAPARYEVQLQLTGDEDETLIYPINNIHDKEPAYIEVVEAQTKPLMAKVEAFWSDDANDKVEGGRVDLAEMSVFKIGVALRTTEHQSYQGPVTLWTEDVSTGESIQVHGIDDEVIVSSHYEVPLYSYWLRKSNLPWADGSTYRLRVMGQINGDEVELSNPQTLPYYLKREGDVLTLFQQNVVTQAAVASFNTTLSVRCEGNSLKVTAPNLRNVRLYAVSGQCVKQAMATNGRQAVCSLQGLSAGVYLLRIKTAHHCHTQRVLLTH